MNCKCSEPFEASCPTNFQAELFPDGRFDYRCSDSCGCGGDRVHTISFTPFDPGGTFTWDEAPSPSPRPLLLGASGGPACGCVTCSGNTVTYGCTVSCTCNGNCQAVGGYCYENAMFAITGGVCRCGFDDPDPSPPETPGEDIDTPSFSIAFSKPAVMFEEAYENSSGSRVPKRSTRVRLTVSVHGGFNGGTFTVASQNLDKLALVAGETMELPIFRTLAPGESFYSTCVYEAGSESDAFNDISLTGVFVENDTDIMSTSFSRLTSVRVEFKPDVPIGNCVNRHIVGVRETSKVSWVPQAVALQVTVDSADSLVLQGGKWKYLAPIIGASPCLCARYFDVCLPMEIEVKEPEYIFVRAVEAFDYVIPRNIAGGAGMELALHIYPTNVSFMGIAVQEVPSNYRDPWGYFDNVEFSELWSHTRDRSAGVWHNIQLGNLFMYDVAEMGESMPCMRSDGIIARDEEHCWISGGMNWMIPVGWNEIGSDDEDTLPIKNFQVYWQRFRMSVNGTLEVEKLGKIVERGTNDVICINGEIQHKDMLRPR